MDSSLRYKLAPLQLPLVTIDVAILEKNNVPLPQYHLADLVGEKLIGLVELNDPTNKSNINKLAMSTHEFHRNLKRLANRETDKDPASIDALLKESRIRLLTPIAKVLRTRYNDIKGIVNTKKLIKAREFHLRSQVNHAPEKLTPEVYTEAIAALQKGIMTPRSRDKSYKAMLQGVLAREQRSSRLDPVSMQSTALASSPSNARGRRGAVSTDTKDAPDRRKRSKTVAMTPEEEWEIELFGSLETDSSDNDMDANLEHQVSRSL
ncbi:hypothetical protein EV426DRAFT_699766 [Tirmania nivea]|nr:hypothetical protein EV426DRAFT_699766 [Tirmania nivea]